ncbi:hypothetical protein OV090_23060 [Nannocystis sp. RBIL2]|uniref:hypothetical protein n=1 Tax=Nannocystis sp. RBIL2 TaxID=2996788 RepID=UPI0022722280|nr:hypothetical protein [Nannocystis sp. RBIL2]MCY1067646.1 hypothetical protein [Nannocystis sp. RBIL2]
MRLRSRPALFTRVFVDAATTRPLLHDLLEQRRAAEPLTREPAAPVTAPAALPHAA